MKIYIVSLAVGILVGLLYGGLNVRSPAPPVAALVGLFGMLMGEQMISYGKQFVANRSAESHQMTVTDGLNATNLTDMAPSVKTTNKED